MARERRDCTCPRARHEHGTRAGFQTCGCHCLPCRLAYNEATYHRRRGGDLTTRADGWIDRTGTRRRIEALHAIGWSGGALARKLGFSVQALHHARTLDRPIYPATALRIAALYDELWDQAPPEATKGERVGASTARRLARRNGWAPPLAWDDETIDDPAAVPHDGTCGDRLVVVNDPPFEIYGGGGIPGDIDEIAVERAMLGDRVKLTKAERSEAVRTMTDVRGMSASEIAVRLATTKRTVVRDRSAA